MRTSEKCQADHAFIFHSFNNYQLSTQYGARTVLGVKKKSAQN